MSLETKTTTKPESSFMLTDPDKIAQYRFYIPINQELRTSDLKYEGVFAL